jgi:hypothetical protein
VGKGGRTWSESAPGGSEAITSTGWAGKRLEDGAGGSRMGGDGTGHPEEEDEKTRLPGGVSRKSGGVGGKLSTGSRRTAGGHTR